MANMARWYVYTVAALLAAPLVLPPSAPLSAKPAAAQNRSTPAHKRAPAKQPALPPHPQAKQLPPRIPFTVADEVAAAIPGMPDARFWADSVADFIAALPPQPGPWLALSSGGADGAFGAGPLNGLSECVPLAEYIVV